MALPLIGVMVGAQLIGGIFGLIQNHQNNEMAEKVMKQMQDRDKQMLQWFGQVQGGAMPPGMMYPGLQQMG
jgi:hypothetical protein